MADQNVWVPRRDWYNGRDNRDRTTEAVCYTRQEPAPGVHQDVPHMTTQCMEAGR